LAYLLPHASGTFEIFLRLPAEGLILGEGLATQNPTIFLEDKTMPNMQEKARENAAALEGCRLKNGDLPAAAIDPLEDLKVNLMRFFKDKAAIIQQGDSLKSLLYQKFMEKVEKDDFSNFDELLKLFKIIGKETNAASGHVLGLFKPVPNTPSLFLEVSRPPDKDEEIKELYKNLSAEQLQSLERASVGQELSKTNGQGVDAATGQK
jgi:hypothetical protein